MAPPVHARALQASSTCSSGPAGNAVEARWWCCPVAHSRGEQRPGDGIGTTAAQPGGGRVVAAASERWRKNSDVAVHACMHSAMHAAAYADACTNERPNGHESGNDYGGRGAEKATSVVVARLARATVKILKTNRITVISLCMCIMILSMSFYYSCMFK